MAFRNEADEIAHARRDPGQKGYIYRGLKPVNWCFDCQSALAEAEVEYEDRTDIAIDVGFEVDPRDRAALAHGVRPEQLPDGPVRAVIWTTTPWTIPANQALTVHPDLTYSLVETDRGKLHPGDRAGGRPALRASASQEGAGQPVRAQVARPSRSRASVFATRSTTANRRCSSANT